MQQVACIVHAYCGTNSISCATSKSTLNGFWNVTTVCKLHIYVSLKMIQWSKHIGNCDLNKEGHIINLLYFSGIRLNKQNPVELRMWYNINTVTSKYFVFYRHETCSSWVYDFMWSVYWYQKFLHFCRIRWWNVCFRRSNYFSCICWGWIYT